MNNVLVMLLQQWTKMVTDKSWLIGAATGGISFAIPGWVTGKELRLEHVILLGILMTLFVIEWLVGGRLAKKSTQKRKNSTTMIDSAIRDFIILLCCFIAYGFDYLLGTGALIFTVFTGAFIYHNFYSLMANIVVLGWGDFFPMWLFKWLEDEIEAKKDKYFPEKQNNDKGEK
ncbi:phage holin family protein [Enterococcus sp. DIV1420a]|uniref:phage holin family protein n=1 Tax=Enterococcus sp. DIV1420a TaxID=2774672 RepID=UPI003F245052